MMNVHLSDDGLWILFRGFACHVMEAYGLTARELGCELWEFTESLDMSFEEYQDLPIEMWGEKMEREVRELKADLVKQH